MDIEIVWGTGEGQSVLGAFDAALAAAGIHNYNLVTMSSVVPPETSVIRVGTHTQRWEVGDKVAVVLARNESSVTGETIAAGLGWSLAEEGGIFFEACAESRQNVRSLLKQGIESGKAQRDGWSWQSGLETKIVDHTVIENGASVVASIYGPI